MLSRSGLRPEAGVTDWTETGVNWALERDVRIVERRPFGVRLQHVSLVYDLL